MGKRGKINEGLKRWNFIRSQISRLNRQSGKKYKGVEINALVKDIQRDFYGLSTITEGEINTYLTNSVKGLVSNPLEIPFSDLKPAPYFSLDTRIRVSMPKGVNIVVNAGEYGITQFNTLDYNYTQKNGLKSIVEKIRDVVGNDSPKGLKSTGNFMGFVIPYEKPFNKENKYAPENYYIEFVLIWKGKPIKQIKNFIPAKLTETRVVIPKKSKESKQILKNIKVKKQLKQETYKQKIEEKIQKEVQKRTFEIQEKLKLTENKLKKEEAKNRKLIKSMQKDIDNLKEMLKKNNIK